MALQALKQNAIVSAGMIGKSSTRVMWWISMTYQSTISVFSSGSSSAIHRHPATETATRWSGNLEGAVDAGRRAPGKLSTRATSAMRPR